MARKPYSKPDLQVFGSIKLLTMSGGSTTTEGQSGKGKATTGSDPRLKCNVAEVGRHPQGFGLYLFDYKPEFQAEFGAGRRFGVMADEVEAIVPDAVSTAADGYKRVDYRALGIELNG